MSIGTGAPVPEVLSLTEAGCAAGLAQSHRHLPHLGPGTAPLRNVQGAPSREMGPSLFVRLQYVAFSSLRLNRLRCGLNNAQGFFDHGVVGMARNGRCVWVIKVRYTAPSAMPLPFSPENTEYASTKALAFFHVVRVLKHCVASVQAGMMREGWQKFKATGLTDRDVARHIAFCHDFLYKVLDTEPMPEGGRTIWINDLKGEFEDLSA